MLNTFKDHLNNNLPFLIEGKLLLAISGGLDSVVLCHLCSELNLNLAFAHCNFNLRGKESDGDEEFIMQLGESLDVEVFVQHFNTDEYAKIQKISTQMAARDLRYSWFLDLANQLQFDYILTAHHTDDDLETFLINLSRGTGLDGLCGIPEMNETIVRPLLPFSQERILNYANKNKLIWREDISNMSTKYLRNKIRLELIPKLKELNPQFLENFKSTQENLREIASIVEDQMDNVADQVVNVCDEGIHLDIKKLKDLNNPKAYLYQLLKAYEFTQWDDIYYLLDAQSGKQIYSKEWCLLKDRNSLILTKISDSNKGQISIAKLINEVKTPFGILFFDEADALFGRRTNLIYVDKNKLQFPLTIRKWVEGDVFYPKGMQGKKKVSKYFKDEKLSLVEKEKTWLLCSGNEIVWIINRRADERFIATDRTENILKIELK